MESAEIAVRPQEQFLVGTFDGVQVQKRVAMHRHCKEDRAAALPQRPYENARCSIGNLGPALLR
jgi:hypothetical protein